MIATYERAETGEQLLLHERLRDVVICTEIEAGHAIVDRVTGGQHHDGSPLSVAEAAQHLTAVHHRHEVIEHDRVVITLHRLMETFLAIGGPIRGVALFAEELKQSVPQGGFIFDNQEAHQV